MVTASEMGKKGGQAKSEAKASAARKNASKPRGLRLALVKERDELRADAERFRWMRANLTRLVVATQGGDAPRKVESLWVNENMPAPCEASVDAAVDAAMTAAPAVGAA